MTKVFKVDRVRSVAEAESLEAAGADLITVSLDPDPRFGDFRHVSVKAAAAIKSSLHRAHFLVEVDFDLMEPDRVSHIATELELDRIQAVTSAIPPLEVRRALKRQQVSVGYAHIDVSHEDDPGWVMSRYQDVSELNSAFFQLEMLPEYDDSWRVWRDESPKYPNEIQIHEINELARKNFIIVGLNFTPGNVVEIAEALPDIRGMVMTLGEQPTHRDLHCAMPDEVLETLRTVKETSPGRVVPSP